MILFDNTNQWKPPNIVSRGVSPPKSPKQERMVGFSSRKVISVSFLALTQFVGLDVSLGFCDLE